ncbi:MAG: hypothetical protein HFI46_02220 [Lachnospiraceae bacterium]|jgi:hypothetical protein|nr:hypothetical protein [Lachnospiraceae bacterium]
MKNPFRCGRRIPCRNGFLRISLYKIREKFPGSEGKLNHLLVREFQGVGEGR